jgi:hypothetical protein
LGGDSSKQLEMELPYYPHLGDYPKKCKTGYIIDTCKPMFIAALFTIAKSWKQPRCPITDEWIMRLWYIYTRNNYMGFEGKWMLLEDIMLREVSQDQKQKTCIFSLLHGR